MNPRPHLNAFFFCERVLQEQDGVSSVIRIIDILGVPELSADPKQGKPVAVVPITMFVSFKSGEFKGLAEITLVGKRPSGKELKRESVKAEFEGGTKGINLIVNAELLIPEEGVYWFELYLDNELVTKTPLSVVIAKSQSEAKAAAAGQGHSPSATSGSQREE